MSFPIIYELGQLSSYATDGKIILKMWMRDKHIDFSIRNYHRIKPCNNCPEDIKRKFDEVFSDPLTEIEWLKWKSQNIV